MAAKGSVPDFKTLKECLEFLQWLHSDKNMQYRVTRRLKKLLEKKYAKVNEQQIDTALSTFLTIVSKFYTKLCQKAGHGKNMPDKARDAFYALLQCIPKFLSVMYYLRYNVDSNFAGVGGGRWAKQQVGTLALYARLGSQMVERMKSTASDIEKYLIEKGNSNFGVIPGGFDPSDLKQIGDRDSYSEGSIMLHDLINICDKKDGQLFRDVFVTSVLSKNSGVDVSNIANALRMVEDFCGIFENVEKDDFTSHVQSRGQCINWQTLKDHCTKLKETLGKMFKQGVFSFTGYGRTYGFLDKKNIAKKMANWFRANLDEVRINLARITPFDSKQYNLKTRNKKLPQYYAGLGAHLAKYLFPYGFTFEGRSFKTGTTPYEDLKKHWDAVIGDLKKDDGGLATLKKILDGNQCANGQKQREPTPKSKPKPGPEPEPEPEPEPGPELEPEDEDDLADDDEVDSDEELMKELSDEEDLAAQKTEVTKAEAAKPTATKTEATKTEAAKPVVTKAEAAKPQAQNVENAQNQGKKAEATPNQNNGQSEEKPGSSPVAQAAEHKDSSAPSPRPASSGADVPGSGRGPGGTGSTSDSAEPGSEESHTEKNNASTLAPTGHSTGSSDGGDGKGGGSEKMCSDGSPPVELYPYGFKYCRRGDKVWDASEQKKMHDDWDEKKRNYELKLERNKKKIEERLRRQKEAENLKMEVEERIKEDERQLQREAMLPRIDVVYMPQELSENLDVAYNTAAQRHLNQFVSPMPFDIIKPTNRDAVIDDDHGTGEVNVNGSVLDGASGTQFEEFEGKPVQNFDEQSKRQQDYYSAVDITKSPGVEGYEIPDPFFSDKRQTEIDKELGKNQKDMASELQYQYYQGLGDTQSKWKQSIVDTEQAEKKERKRQIDARIQNVIERVRERNERKNKAAQNLDKKYEQTTEKIWKTQQQQNLDYIEENVKDDDAKKRLQQKRLRHQKKLEQQNISSDTPSSTDSTLPSQPSRPAPAPSGQIPFSSQPPSGIPANQSPQYVPQERSSRERVGDIEPFDLPMISVGGSAVPDFEHEEKEAKLKKLSLAKQTTEKWDWDAKQAELYKQMQKEKVNWNTQVREYRDNLHRQSHETSRTPFLSRKSSVPIVQNVDILVPPITARNISGAAIEIPAVQLDGDSALTAAAIQQPTGHSIPDSKINFRKSPFTPSSKPTGRDDSLTQSPHTVTFDDNIMLSMTGASGQPVVGVNGKVDTSQIPSDIRVNAGDRYHLEGQEVQDDKLIKRQERNIQNLQNAQMQIDSENKQRERKLQALKEKSKHINEEQRELMEAAKSDADRIRAFKDSQFDISSAPLRVDEMQFDIQIDVPKRPLQDSSYDIDLDDPYANTADILKDELKPSDDKGFSGLPNTNFNLDFAPERAGPMDYEDPGMPRDPARKTDERVINPFHTDECQNPWSVDTSSTSPTSLPSPVPTSDNMPPPKTVREMLYWFVGLNTQGYIGLISEHVKGLLKGYNTDALEVTGDPQQLTSSHVTTKLTEACLYSATVIYKIKHNNDFKAFSTFDFKSEYSQLHYSPDPAGLLCQLRDYVYACHYQLEFLKSQCSRYESHGGWKNYDYGNAVSPSDSPLHSFLTDGWDSDFDTHPFDPCNLCHKSRVRMGFKIEDLPEKQHDGTILSSILSPSCGGSDPLLTLSSYLNCITRRTPRTTGELVSYFHNFGNELHGYALKALSSLGTAITKSHADCPDWDCLGASDLQAVSGLRGSEALNMISNNNHDNEHPRTLSTLVGCGSDPANCHPRMSPITYRAYALYSQSFAHTYLSWTVYLPDRLLESLQKLHYDLQKHLGSGKCTSLYLCPVALPLLYTHGFTPPEVGSQVSLKCSDVITKLKDIVNGRPIASLMTAMDEFLYGIREPFIFTLVAMWSLAFLIFANAMLYRLDILHIRSHLIRSKASHRIDVKALLTKGRKMMSLYDAHSICQDVFVFVIFYRRSHILVYDGWQCTTMVIGCIRSWSAVPWYVEKLIKHL
ncbi:hypothetical protein BBBOND_0211960 [Babesia bigemina]|uniref:Ribosome-binding protein 1 n=1 Tax=Babesia bigemina TaxID=5866 RepID=A0A061DAV5_BABBI|nr:hypothetical protein BBBOND_0211960 [Babesia bigemina]CDR96054.1 hypothetical protein BBBOND_0211960 [Babesia bigemina]|eukprot:XP_012768240.1 hypothetical protein BBBOND_0211960 [Babesia bigemina]